MNKLSMLLLAAALLVGTTGSSLAATHKMSVVIPDEGYNFGYAAGTRYVNTNPSESQLGDEWHKALRNVEFYTSIGETGRADWWQGYADALNYFDNNSY